MKAKSINGHSPLEIEEKLLREMVIEKVIQGCKEMQKNEMPEADALVIFTCGGRLVSLGPLMNEEIEGVNNIWKVPMAGMFSNAELARATNGNLGMHNLTNCCVALKEK